ncbi:hypothetical protein EYR36_008573 [Pleurotus pulmonarius]|nr:hypothetical protein EYR36_008573 [Pleurotus pulmonarius]
MAVALPPHPLPVDEYLPGPSTTVRSRMDSGSTIVAKRVPSFRDRQLPPIPQHDGDAKSFTAVRSRMRSKSPSVVKSRHLSSFLPSYSRRFAFPTMLRQNPRVLARLLRFMSWTDFLSFAGTCRDLMNLLGPLETKDVVLSRFIPGYSDALRGRDLRRFRDVSMSLHDLNLLILSETTPLHQYPMHALSCLSAFVTTLDQEERTHRLIELTQAHSRAVLLLQSVVHSSSYPIPPEPRDDAKASLRNLQRPVLRELTFPAPLSYQLSDQPVRDELASRSPSNSKHVRGHTVADVAPGLHQRRTIPKAPATSTPSVASKARKRLSKLVNAQAAPPPPPAAMPRALKVYSDGWRRASRFPIAATQSDDEGGSATFSSRRTTMVIPNGYGTIPLKRPSRRFASANTSSDSSLGSSPSQSHLSRSSIVDTPSSSPAALSPSASTYASCNSLAPPPHDLNMAKWRARAPILRVFVPCTELATDGSNTIGKCKEQLINSRLWDHLSAGDIVCNLGYVPGGPRAQASEDSNVQGPEFDDAEPQSQQKWLLYDGEDLVAYLPPHPPPILDVLTLPSPFYYTHIMPALANPPFIVDRLPMFNEGPQMTLLHSSTRVKSPHSPNGYAVVKKHMWIARVVKHPSTGYEEDDAIGEGWTGEWILEGEGTREGKQALLQCFDRWASGVVKKELELVREKSGGGRLWFKLLNSYSDNLDPTDNGQMAIYA